MRIRTQLVVSFLLLSVVPLAGITLWSFVTSRAAVRKAREAEAQKLADEIRDPVEAAIGKLRARMQRFRGRRTPHSEFDRALAKAIEAAEREEMKLLLVSILAPQQVQEGVVPFARDIDGWLYAPTPPQAAIAAALGLGKVPNDLKAPFAVRPEDWVVALTKDLGSGIAVGVARPIEEPLRVMRGASVRNLFAGLAIVALAILGILPLSRRMTARLDALAEGAIELGKGNLDVRVPVASHDEFGRLAATFNHMAEELKPSKPSSWLRSGCITSSRSPAASRMSCCPGHRSAPRSPRSRAFRRRPGRSGGTSSTTSSSPRARPPSSSATSRGRGSRRRCSWRTPKPRSAPAYLSSTPSCRWRRRSTSSSTRARRRRSTSRSSWPFSTARTACCAM